MKVTDTEVVDTMTMQALVALARAGAVLVVQVDAPTPNTEATEQSATPTVHGDEPCTQPQSEALIDLRTPQKSTSEIAVSVCESPWESFESPAA